MDTKQFIESGILERYAMGKVSEQEMAAVQCLSKIYPEISRELIQIESSLEKYTLLHSVTPPDHLKSKIFDKIKSLPKDDQIAADQNQSKAEKTITRGNTYWLRAAVVLALVGLAATLFLYTQNNLSYQEQIAELKDDISGLSSELSDIKSFSEQQEQLIAAIRSPEFSLVQLEGLEGKDPGASANVYWNEQTNEMLLVINQLTSPSAGKDYQLWAIVDDTPVDAGVFEVDEFFTYRVLESIESPIAFAVTLEDEGGVPEPTLEEMYLFGANPGLN